MSNVLHKYLPEHAVQSCFELIKANHVHLKIVNERVTRHGDYRKDAQGYHLITVNANLNKYRFLMTLIHEIDYLFWLFGKFKSVYATGGSLTKLNINVEDTVVSNIVTNSNIPISLRMDYWRNPPTRQLNIVGEKGQLFWDYYSKETTIIYNSGKKIVNKLPKNWNRNYMFVDIIKDFILRISKNKKIKIPLKDGIYALKVAIALKKSLTQSKKILI